MTRALLSVQIKDVWFALDATTVLEILGEQRWAPVPDAPAHVPGVLSWRGRAVATLDLGALTGTSEPLSQDQPRRRTVVVRSIGCTFALPVDAVREVQEIPADRLTPPHVTQQRYSCGEVELSGTIMPV